MHVVAIQWPTDPPMTPEELAEVPAAEAIVRDVFRNLRPDQVEAATSDPDRIQAIISAVFARSPALGRVAWRLIVALESEVHLGTRRMGVRVRFQWHALESDRRAGAERARARAAAAEPAFRGERPRPAPIPIPRAGAEPRGGELERAGVVTIEVQNATYGAALAVTRAELEATDDLNLYTNAIAAAERAMAGVMPDTATPRELERLASSYELGNVVERGNEIHRELERAPSYRDGRVDFSMGAPRFVAIEVHHEVSIDGVLRTVDVQMGPFRVQFEIEANEEIRPGDTVVVDPASGRARRGYPSRDPDPRNARLEYHPRTPARTPSERPIAALIARQLPVSFAELLDGCVVRTRELGPPMSCRGDSEEALAEMLNSRRPGDRFYFVRGTSPLDALKDGIPPFTWTPEIDPMSEIPGTLAWSIAQRKRGAVELVLRICYVIATAAAKARDRAEVFYTFARACLEPWAKNPTPIELDIELAPFGVDMTPPADDFAARCALLEIELED